jgi:phosphoribosyl-AMP cyclohydrolase
MYICTHDHFVGFNDMIGGSMENLERIPVFVPKEHKEELRRIAYENRTSVSEEVRKAVAVYLDKMKEE